MADNLDGEALDHPINSQ